MSHLIIRKHLTIQRLTMIVILQRQKHLTMQRLTMIVILQRQKHLTLQRLTMIVILQRQHRGWTSRSDIADKVKLRILTLSVPRL